jgi:hypothetical protein
MQATLAGPRKGLTNAGIVISDPLLATPGNVKFPAGPRAFITDSPATVAGPLFGRSSARALSNAPPGCRRGIGRGAVPFRLSLFRAPLTATAPALVFVACLITRELPSSIGRIDYAPGWPPL